MFIKSPKLGSTPRSNNNTMDKHIGLIQTIKYHTGMGMTNKMQEPSMTSKRQQMTKAPIQFSSVTQPCPTLCDPMNRSTPGLPVHHQLPKFTQTHDHQVGDAIQPSHPLPSPSPPAPNPSRHLLQDLFM